MSNNKKPKAKKAAAPAKTGLVVKSSSLSTGRSKSASMIPSNSVVSSSKKGAAQNSAPRKAQ